MNNEIFYVGIDVSKKKLDVSITLDGKHYLSSKQVDNNVKGFEVLEKWAYKHTKKYEICEIRYCIESTGIYSEKVSDFFLEKNYYVSVMNPALIKAYHSSLNLRTKTDKVDAKAIASYCAVVKPKATPKTPGELREYRILVRHLDYLIRRRAEEKGHIESARSSMVKDLTNQTISLYDQQIGKVMDNIEKHVQKYSKLKKNLLLLESIPGIGTKTAQMLVCELHIEDGESKISKKAQTAHAGLAPAEKQSGSSVRGKTRLCKTGNPRLRKSLYFPAMTAIKYNPFVSEFYNRLLEKGKPKKVALIACMRKLLVIAIGVLNNQREFDVDWLDKKRIEQSNSKITVMCKL